jgi:hypothetical protein
MEFGRLAAVEIRPDNLVETETPFRIEGLKITFTVKRNLKKSTNQAIIEIYNLSEVTRARIQERTRKVTLFAGYSEGAGLQLLFDGSIMTVNHSIAPPHIVTRIEANDGQTRMRQAHMSKSYEQGAKGSRILKDIIQEFGLPVRFMADLPEKDFPQGYVIHGPAKDALEDVCLNMGAEWSIQNGLLQILAKGGTDGSDPSGLLLTARSGLIGSPERLRQIQDDPNAEKKPSGYTIKSVLVPTITPGGYIAVQSRNIIRPTAYRVENVEHKGDTHGDEWTSTTEVYDPGILI